MPYDDPDMTDPMTLTGVVFETNDLEAHREMAACFIEEYLRLGFSADRIRRMFRVSGYAGPHLALQQLGEDAIEALLLDQCARWGPRVKPAESSICQTSSGGDIRLNVLENRS